MWSILNSSGGEHVVKGRDSSEAFAPEWQGLRLAVGEITDLPYLLHVSRTLYKVCIRCLLIALIFVYIIIMIGTNYSIGETQLIQGTAFSYPLVTLFVVVNDDWHESISLGTYLPVGIIIGALTLPYCNCPT